VILNKKLIMSQEFEIIKKYFLPLTNGNDGSFGLEDDVAKISLAKNKELVISKDLMMEDVHFTKSVGAKNIAAKLLLSNLSDVAASGAKPKYFMLGFSQNNFDEEFIKEFCQGLKEVADKFEIDLIGGDSVKVKGKLAFSLTIFGEIEKGKALIRKNAENGDLIFVSGNIGDSFLGLKLLNGEISCLNQQHTDHLILRHLLPNPRVKLGQELVKISARCAIDVSDGLFADLNHLCQASNLSASIEQNLIPISNAASSCLNENIILNDLFSGGEDYELVFAVNPELKSEIGNLAKKLKIKLTEIGRFKKDQECKMRLLDKNNEEVDILEFGWKHY
jgi:thiamine-monophosphate kinase